jgi:hypothetical protein
MKQKLASPKIHELRAKLAALAERGINGEKDVAAAKLARLDKRYDFNTPNNGGTDIFKGVFVPEPSASWPIIRLDPEDLDIGNFVKWSIEHTTGVPCLFHGPELCARATVRTAEQLQGIAKIVATAFRLLWQQFSNAPSVNTADRPSFILGLYEGMMDEVRTNEALPKRAHVDKVKKAKKGSVAKPAGLVLHPYTVATGLGKQVRFSVPFLDIAGELDRTVKGALQNV